MKTLAVLIILVLAALYVNAGGHREGGKRRQRPGGRRDAVEEVEGSEACDPARQYGWGVEQVDCRCSNPRAIACLKCNVCRCMSSRGLWRCTRMGCPFEEEGLPWEVTQVTDRRGGKRPRCAQPVPDELKDSV